MTVIADIRYALRLLVRTPVFAVASIATLALGMVTQTENSRTFRRIVRANPFEDSRAIV